MRTRIADPGPLRDAFALGELGALAPAVVALAVASACYAWAVLRGASA